MHRDVQNPRERALDFAALGFAMALATEQGLRRMERRLAVRRMDCSSLWMVRSSAHCTAHAL